MGRTLAFTPTSAPTVGRGRWRGRGPSTPSTTTPSTTTPSTTTTTTSSSSSSSSSRRALLLGAALGTVVTLTLTPGAALAASSNPGLLDPRSFLPTFFSPIQPEAIRFPRRALNQTLGVLLMRSAYEALDELDCFPLDKFQIAFWKFRESQLESYGLLISPLRPRTGDLTDPLYFDFISFSQWAAVDK